MAEEKHQLVVLVMDMDSRTLDLTARHLEYSMAGIPVLRVGSYGEALNLVRTRCPGFFVIDCDGSEHERARLLETIAQACPKAKVVLTTRSSVLRLNLGNVAGLLFKPYRIDDLLDLARASNTGGQ